MKSPQWVRTLWNKYGSKLQRMADRIEAWEYPEPLKKALQKLSKALPEVIIKAIMKEVEKAHKKYGPEAGKGKLEDILIEIKKFTF